MTFELISTSSSSTSRNCSALKIRVKYASLRFSPLNDSEINLFESLNFTNVLLINMEISYLTGLMIQVRNGISKNKENARLIEIWLKYFSLEILNRMLIRQNILI